MAAEDIQRYIAACEMRGAYEQKSVEVADPAKTLMIAETILVVLGNLPTEYANIISALGYAQTLFIERCMKEGEEAGLGVPRGK